MSANLKTPLKYVDKRQLADLGLSDLTPVLLEWIELNEKYLHASKDDCPWWYNERPLVGILAAAAWRKGFVVLEEYSVRKGRRKDETDASGRCDLKIWANKNSVFRFEAKQIKIGLGRRRKKGYRRPADQDEFIEGKCRKIMRSLDRARKDAGELKTERQERRLALCFVCPKINKNEQRAIREEALDKLIASLSKKNHRNKKPAFSLSWFFVDRPSQLVKRTSVYPGVILLVKEVKKRNQRLRQNMSHHTNIKEK
jgi:hypothetical protein